MRLSQLLHDDFKLFPEWDCDILGLQLDSRKIKSGDLFLAVKGHQEEGSRYIAHAITRGASAVLLDVDQFEPSFIREGIPIIPIVGLRQQLGFIGEKFYDYPSKKLRVIGVTGTNGKTSCTHFIAQLLALLKVRCGIIGTLGNGFYGNLTETKLTTPDALTLQFTLNEMLHANAAAVAMEVSSHSIHQHRVAGIDFDMGIFTNLTQDHLDYHGDMATYAGVKHHFLAELCKKTIIINADDDYGVAWLQDWSKRPQTYAYGTALNRVSADIPFIYASSLRFSTQGIQASLNTPWGEGDLYLPLIGTFNLSNALAALTALCVYGFSLEAVLEAFSYLKPVPGRMQMLGGGKKPLVVVDYAHTPDALEKVLQALRAHTQGKLICVFGCGGERDKSKRPKMARIAEQYADRIIVTNDNPRHEIPEAIALEITAGFVDSARHRTQLDRAKAIKESIQSATILDCVLIAGKGAEHYQQIGDQQFPFDDVQQVKLALGIAEKSIT